MLAGSETSPSDFVPVGVDGGGRRQVCTTANTLLQFCEDGNWFIVTTFRQWTSVNQFKSHSSILLIVQFHSGTCFISNVILQPFQCFAASLRF